jgi:hypothetical protein
VVFWVVKQCSFVDAENVSAGRIVPIFCFEDGGNIYNRNVSNHLHEHVASQPRRSEFTSFRGFSEIYMSAHHSLFLIILFIYDCSVAALFCSFSIYSSQYRLFALPSFLNSLSKFFHPGLVSETKYQTTHATITL